MSRAESEAVCSPLLGFPLGSGRKREQFLWLPPRTPSVCKGQGLPRDSRVGGPRATSPEGAVSKSSYLTHLPPPHTLDGLHGVRGLGLVVVTAQSPQRFCRRAGCGELERRPE